jgi:hypothetical protein
MADAVLLSDCSILLGPYQIKRSVNQIELTCARAELVCNRMGDTAETYAAGLQQINASTSGFWASDAIAAATEIDPRIWPRIDAAQTPAAWPLTVAPPYAPAAVAGADGNACYVVQTKQFSYSLFGAHGTLAPFTVASRAYSGGLYRGTVVLPETLVTVTTTGTGRQLGALSATQKLVAVLHVTAIDGGSWVLTVESDDNAGFTTATTRATFTAATTITTQVIETNGAITDDYFRVVLTKTGGTSCTAFAALAIANQ